MVFGRNIQKSLEHANSILETFEYFCQIGLSSKSIHIISSYTVSKLVHFLRHSVETKYDWDVTDALWDGVVVWLKSMFHRHFVVVLSALLNLHDVQTTNQQTFSSPRVTVTWYCYTGTRWIHPERRSATCVWRSTAWNRRSTTWRFFVCWFLRKSLKLTLNIWVIL